MPASKGRAPKSVARQFVPLAAVVNHENPKLLLDPTLIGHPEALVANNHLTVWGDPLAKLGPTSNGSGAGAGIGSGRNGGIGRGEGQAFGPGRDGGTGGDVL
jgi:periplasmic protein TonB